MDGVSVLIPWQPGCPHREAALEWVMARYRETGWKVVLMETTGPWSKARAIMGGLSEMSDVVVIADADCWTDGVHAAVAAVAERGHAGQLSGPPWAVPHRKVYRLTERATAKVLGGAEPSIGLPTIDPPYVGVKGGGVVVVRRSTLGAVPFDTRYVGWGRTDLSWREAMKTLVGEPWRYTEQPLFHLHHPPQERPTRTTGSEANEALYQRYKDAYGNQSAMRRLIRECSTR